MAQHFVTVCVVCVLCAAHTPCYAHMDVTPSVKQTVPSVKYSTELPGYSEHLLPHRIDPTDVSHFNNVNTKTSSKGIDNSERLFNKVPDENNNYYNNEKLHKDDRLEDDLQRMQAQQEARQIELMERLGQHDLEFINDSKANRQSNIVSRLKRSSELDEKYFTKKIFEMFGDGENMTMEGFQKLLKKLGLFQSELKVSEQETHSINSNQSGSRLVNNKETQQSNKSPQIAGKGVDSKQRCLSSSDLLSAFSDDPTYKSTVKSSSNSSDNNNNNSSNSSTSDNHNHNNNDNDSNDSSSNNNFNKNNTTKTLPVWLFERICPALIYQLTAVSAQERGDCIHVTGEFAAAAAAATAEIGDYDNTEETARNMFQVWVYSTVSILIISLCGLLGVAVIPVMGKSYYHQLLQFLVALAVGTLCGDALIHLLPHAMMSAHSHTHDISHTHLAAFNSDEDDHNANMWKGFVAMIGLVLFFFTEKALNIISEWRKYNQNQTQLPARVKVMRESDAGNTNVVGEKLCKHKYSTSYPYCYGEIATETQDNLHQHNHHERPQTIEEAKPLTCNSTCNSVSNKIMQNDVDKKNNEDWKLDDTVINDTKKVADGSDVPLNESESYTVIIREHDAKHHGHGHAHSHVHTTPDSMSSVAWMVVMGDGLHNFTDGMAIGAAFSANIAGGFSTTIAVFCHELPHELGDFAVLLKAGMSAKQAVFYNLLSSVLCLFGMVFGVLLGATPAASSWMFAAAAGMFIYIALVDMIPELSSDHSIAHGAHWQCLLQAAGLITGFSIMLLIALYEHDLQTLFNS